MMTMKIAFLIPFLLQIVFCGASENGSYIDQIEKRVFDQIERGSVQGVAIAIIENGKVVLSKGYGFANINQHLPITENTVFELASISKTISAIGVLHLVELGKLHLDEAASVYLKTWSLPPSNFDHKKITIRRLLNHTAGLAPVFYRGTISPDFSFDLVDSLNGVGSPDEQLEIAYDPGSYFQYSGAGYTLLQLIIEEVTGISFQEYMKTEIFEPLGLTHTTFDLSTLNNKDLAVPYDFFGRAIPHHFYTEQAAAGLYSTISDLSKMMLYLTRLYHLQVDSKIGQVISSNSLKSMMEINENNYALGFETEMLKKNRLLAFHTGDNFGTRTGMFLLPSQMDGCAVLINSDAGLELVEEIGNIWLESRTEGESLSFYKEMSELKKWINVFFCAFAIFLFYLTLRTTKKLLDSSMATRITIEISKIAAWVVLISCWLMVLYTPYSFFPGIVLATFLPSNLSNITILIMFFGFLNIVGRLIILMNRKIKYS